MQQRTNMDKSEAHVAMYNSEALASLIDTIDSMCRICAFDLKNKGNGIPIFNRDNLPEKITRYLYIDVSMKFIYLILECSFLQLECFTPHIVLRQDPSHYFPHSPIHSNPKEKQFITTRHRKKFQTAQCTRTDQIAYRRSTLTQLHHHTVQMQEKSKKKKNKTKCTATSSRSTILFI